MKKVILSSIVFAVSLMAHAQSTNPEVEQKIAQMGNAIDSLKSTVTAMQTSMSAMQAKVDEVTKQNLALKQAISLQPTIAEDTSSFGINYRLIEAKGNRKSGEITFIISAVNTGKQDQRLTYNEPVIVDESGYQYKDYKDWKEYKIGNEYLTSGTTLYPDTPVQIILTCVTNSEPQYAKIINIAPYETFKKDGFRFTNIPIKWE